jgi:plasmid maintenance system antidote protein VapI
MSNYIEYKDTIAMKLSKMVGTSVEYWLNLQNSYDALVSVFKSESVDNCFSI